MMSIAASAVCDHSDDVMDTTLGLEAGLIAGDLSARFEKGREHWMKLDDAIEEFIEKARISLDDDGTD